MKLIKVFKKLNDMYFILALSLVLLSTTAIGFLQPAMADDYNIFNLINEHPRFGSFLSHWYFQWTGRLQGVILWYIEYVNNDLHLLFKLLHGLLLIGTAYLSMAIALRRMPDIFRRDRISFLLSLALFWFGLPFLSEVAFWDNGSTVYLFSVFFALLFILPFMLKNYDNGQNSKWALKSSSMFLLGIWVSLGHEQLTAGLIVFLCIFWFPYFRNKKTDAKPVHLLAGTLGFTIGTFILFLAPGNFQRMNSSAQSSPLRAIIIFLGYIFFTVIANAWKDWWPWIVSILIYSLSFSRFKPELLQKDNEGTGKYDWLLWMTVGFVGIAPILFLTAFIVDRAAYFSIVFWNIAVLSVLGRYGCEIEVSQKAGKERATEIREAIIAGLLVSIILVDALLGVNTAFDLNKEAVSREMTITEAKSNKNFNVVIPPFKTKFRRTTFISDISTDYNYWINKAAAKYYGLDSIKLASENQDYKETKSNEMGQQLRQLFQRLYKSRH